MKGFEKTGELLKQLSDIGRPRLSRLKDGKWNANVEFPSPDGVTAEVRSEFHHRTPDEALQTCIDRLGGLQDMLSVKSPVVRNVVQLEQVK